MSAVFVDSNVLIDLLRPSQAWLHWSQEALSRAGERSRLVINVIVYAEVSMGFDDPGFADAAIPADIKREAIPYEAAFVAGKAFRQYRRSGGQKSAPLPDFFIGAHALVAGYELLTHDAKRYRSYFPKLTLIAPN
ncbi:MAG TPA: type II toxin-antitoxin system VapC family toxin [Rhizomicrobium sp.]